MSRARSRDTDLPPGITRRHEPTCPAFPPRSVEACACRPRYQAQAGPRRARQTRTHATVSAAKAWKRDIDRAGELGELTDRRSPLLADAADTWLDHAEAGVVLARGDRRYKPSTLRGYRRCLKEELYPAFGDRRLDRISRPELNEFVRGLAKRGLAPSTIRNVVIPLRAVYRQALEDQTVPVNPTIGMKVPAGSGKRLRFATPAEIPALLAALEHQDRPLWATALYAGLRRGELMGLRWSDVDLAQGVIRVEFSYDPGEKAMVAVKSHAGQDRVVPICAPLRDHLLAHRQRAGARPRGLVFARGTLGGRCYPHQAEEPFADQGVGQRAKRAWDKAATPRITLHEARHTFASLMIAATAAAGTFNPKAIQQMLGHASIQQTYDRYGHLFPGAEQEAARMLDDFLAAPPDRSDVGRAVARLLDLLEHADRLEALPAVTLARDALESWVGGRAPLPSVAPTTAL